jgi:hypothetical protein
MKVKLPAIKKIAEAVIVERFGSLSEADIEEDMKYVLRNFKDNIILEALGLKKGWDNKLELSYSGSFRSNLKILSEEYLNPIAYKILKGVFDNTEIVLTEPQKAHLRKVYKDEYIKTLEREFADLARDAACVAAPGYFKEFIELQEE